MSSGSKARQPSDRNGLKGGGSARTTEEAGQCPWREGAEQDSLFGESNTAAPEADKTVSTKLAGLVARARKEARLTNAVQYVDEALLRLAFGSLRKQAAPGADGQSYEDYAASLDQNLKGSIRAIEERPLPSARNSAGIHPEGERTAPATWHYDDRFILPLLQ